MLDGRRRAAVVTGAVFVIVVVTGSVIAGGSRHPVRRAARPVTTTVTTAPAAARAGAAPVAPWTVVPQETAVQVEDDRALAQGLAASASAPGVMAAPVVPPATSTAWPPLAASSQPEQWAEEFATGLLDIDFARQSRAGLQSWLAAQEAPELLPGVPAPAQDKALYVSLLDPVAAGGGPTPIPPAPVWSAAATAGVVWSVSDVLVQPDPQWSQIVATGWQPVDERFAVEDVSGLLTEGGKDRRSAVRFSMAVYVGSAHWHPGYGTVLVNDWKVT